MSFKKEVRAIYKRVAKQMGVRAPILIFIKGKKKRNGFATFRCIMLTKELAKLVETDPLVVETVIAHELTHYKNRDHRVKILKAFSPSQWYYAYSLMAELRASIGGYSFVGMKTESEIMENEMKWKIPELHEDKIAAYSVGYPTSEQIAYYASWTDKLMVEIAKEILEDYCKVRKVENKEQFIENVLRVTKVY